MNLREIHTKDSAMTFNEFYDRFAGNKYTSNGGRHIMIDLVELPDTIFGIHISVDPSGNNIESEQFTIEGIAVRNEHESFDDAMNLVNETITTIEKKLSEAKLIVNQAIQ